MEKFWTLPELGERLFSFLDPLSTLHLAQSNVMDKKILQKSLTSKAWRELIRRSSLQGLSFQALEHPAVRFEREKEAREDLEVLIKILHFMKLEELSPRLVPLLDLICELSSEVSSYACVEMICPCRPDPHSILPEGFLLLEKVEGAFGTTEQSLKSVRSFVQGWHYHEELSAISSRMSRQKERVASISMVLAIIKDKSDIEAFITLLQAQTVYVRLLNIRREKLGEEDWQALAGALRARGNPEVQSYTNVHNILTERHAPWGFDPGHNPVNPEVEVEEVYISRHNLTGVRESIKDIWNATKYGFEVSDDADGSCSDSSCSQHVEKSKYDGEQAWARLKQIAEMTEDEFAANCKLVQREESQSGGEEEESEDEDHDGEGGEEEDSSEAEESELDQDMK